MQDDAFKPTPKINTSSDEEDPADRVASMLGAVKDPLGGPPSSPSGSDEVAPSILSTSTTSSFQHGRYYAPTATAADSDDETPMCLQSIASQSVSTTSHPVAEGIRLTDDAATRPLLVHAATSPLPPARPQHVPQQHALQHAPQPTSSPMPQGRPAARLAPLAAMPQQPMQMPYYGQQCSAPYAPQCMPGFQMSSPYPGQCMMPGFAAPPAYAQAAPTLEQVAFLAPHQMLPSAEELVEAFPPSGDVSPVYPYGSFAY